MLHSRFASFCPSNLINYSSIGYKTPRKRTEWKTKGGGALLIGWDERRCPRGGVGWEGGRAGGRESLWGLQGQFPRKLPNLFSEFPVSSCTVSAFLKVQNHLT